MVRFTVKSYVSGEYNWIVWDNLSNREVGARVGYPIHTKTHQSSQEEADKLNKRESIEPGFESVDGSHAAWKRNNP